MAMDLPEIGRQLPDVNKRNVGFATNTESVFSGRQVGIARADHRPGHSAKYIFTGTIEQIASLGLGGTIERSSSVVGATTDPEMFGRNMKGFDQFERKVTAVSIPRMNDLAHWFVLSNNVYFSGM